jgi:hypothetical protein
MTVPDDEIYLDPQTVANGVADWDAAAGSLRAAWTERLAAIDGLNTDSTWGADGPGQQFRATYADSGALDLEATAQPLITQDEELGGKVRTAAELTMGADAVQAKQVDIDVQGL